MAGRWLGRRGGQAKQYGVACTWQVAGLLGGKTGEAGMCSGRCALRCGESVECNGGWLAGTVSPLRLTHRSGARVEGNGVGAVTGEVRGVVCGGGCTAGGGKMLTSA